MGYLSIVEGSSILLFIIYLNWDVKVFFIMYNCLPVWQFRLVYFYFTPVFASFVQFYANFSFTCNARFSSLWIRLFLDLLTLKLLHSLLSFNFTWIEEIEVLLNNLNILRISGISLDFIQSIVNIVINIRCCIHWTKHLSTGVFEVVIVPRRECLSTIS